MYEFSYLHCIRCQSYILTGLILMSFLFQDYSNLISGQLCHDFVFIISHQCYGTRHKIPVFANIATKKWLVTHNLVQIYSAKWKMKLIVGNVFRSESQINSGKVHHATFIGADWKLPGYFVRKELESRTVSVFYSDNSISNYHIRAHRYTMFVWSVCSSDATRTCIKRNT